MRAARWRRAVVACVAVAVALTAWPAAQTRAASDGVALALPEGGLARLVFEHGGREIPALAEIARTPFEQRIGLMYRVFMPPGAAMVFVMRTRRMQSFWMQNTLIPLDMLFVDDDGTIVGIVHNAAPLTESQRFVRRRSRYVVEVPGGWAASQGIQAGDRVRFEAL